MRNQLGMSLIEMLSAIFIMAFVGAAMSEIAITQNVVAFRTFNKIEGLVAARRCLSNIEREIHMARDITSDATNPQRMLTITEPEFSSDGIPTGVEDTIVYSVQPYQNVFQLQRAVNGGTAQTVVAGIVGPIDPLTNNPVLFKYFSRKYPAYALNPQQASTDNSASNHADINGISVNIEVLSNPNANTQRTDLTPQSIALRSEIYARSNYMTTHP